MAKDVLAQARGFFDKLNRNQKWIFGGLAVLIVGGMIAIIVALSKPTETTTLFTNLESTDAAKITEYLKANKIDYELTNNASTIVVPKDRADEIRMSIATQGLITDSYVGYELFDKTNLGMSEFVQQLNSRRALEGEMQRMIKSMDEVKDVKVHLVIPKKPLFKQDELPPTAAIKLKLKSGRSLNRLNIEGIQNLVAGSVEGMTPDKVVVTDNNGKMLSEPAVDNNSLAGITATQQEQQRKFENYLADKVQTLLDPAFGSQNTKVKVNTELDFDQLHVEKKDYDPEGQVERSEQTSTDNFRNIDTSFVPGTNESQDKLNEIKNYEISRADSSFEKGIGAIKRLTITAIVNETVEIRHLEDGRDTVVSLPRSDKELNDIKDAIKTAVGFNEQRGDQVNVLCVPFVELLADKVTEVNEYNNLNSIKWYEKEDMQRLLLLLLVLLITGIVMFKIIHAKFAKDKMRIAMGLPSKLEQPQLDKFDSSLIALPAEEEIEEEEEEEEEVEEEVEEEYVEEELFVEEMIDDFDDDFDEMELDDEDIMVIPDELPDQLFLEGELLDELDIIGDIEEEYVDKTESSDSLLERAKSALIAEQQQATEVSEDDLIKMELKDRVTHFITESPDVAIKLFRVFYNQEKV